MPYQSRRRYVFGLENILWAGAAAIFLCTAVIAAHFLAQAWQGNEEARDKADQLVRYEHVLIAVAAISAERGPSNNAMTTEGPAVLEALISKREATDAALDAMVAVFETDLGRTGAQFSQYATLTATLRWARTLVDKVAYAPATARSPREVGAAVTALFQSADVAIELRDKLGGRMAGQSSGLSAEIMLLNDASLLRELSGRLGSYVVLRLAGSATQEEERDAVSATLANLYQVWHTVRIYAPAHLQVAEVQAAVAETNRAYFLGSLTFLEQIIEQLGQGEAISAKEFTDNYVPGLQAAQNLQRRIVAATVEGAIEKANKTGRALVAGIASLAIINCLLLAFALAFSRLFFKPIWAARDEILSLAADDLKEDSKRLSAFRELRELFEGIVVLRQQLFEKREMEQQQLRLMKTLRFQSERDPLTQLLNRRAVNDLAAQHLIASDRENRLLGIIVADLDHFKRINDTYGHAAGDAVLKEAADLMVRTMRRTDMIARIGGEEFLVLFEVANEKQASEIAERLRAAFAAMIINHDPPIGVTASLGLYVRPPNDQAQWNEMVAHADGCLYRAKLLGRNRVCKFVGPGKRR